MMRVLCGAIGRPDLAEERGFHPDLILEVFLHRIAEQVEANELDFSSFDGISSTCRLEETESTYDLFAFWSTLEPVGQVPVHLVLEHNSGRMTYRLEVDRVLGRPKTESKLWNDLYLLSHGQLAEEWRWRVTTQGTVPAA